MLQTMTNMDPAERRRQRRLKDVKRGAMFFKRIETLADEYWRDLDSTPRIMNLKGQGPALPPITSGQSSLSPSIMTNKDTGTSRSSLNYSLSQSLPLLPKSVTFAPDPCPQLDIESSHAFPETQLSFESEDAPLAADVNLDRQPHRRLDHLVEVNRGMLPTLVESQESIFDADEHAVFEKERRKEIATIRRTTAKDLMIQRHYNHRSNLLKELEQPLTRDDTRLILNRVKKLLDPDVISLCSAEGSSRYEWDRGSSADCAALDAILRSEGLEDEKDDEPMVASSWEEAQDFEEFLRTLRENRMTLSEKCSWWLDKKCVFN